MATIMNINSNGTGLSIGTEKAVANTLSCNLPTFDLKNSSGNDVSIIFNRGTSSASWKLLNQGGVLKIQSDWTGSKANYFDVLKLSHTSGNVEISKGGLIFPYSGGQYLIGMDLSKAKISISGTTQSHQYIPIFAMKTANNHYFTIGGVNDQYGFYSFKSGRTANHYDASFVVDASTNMFHLTGDEQISGSLQLGSNLNLPNANKIYWKENGYGDQFAIVPSFGGFDDENLLQFQAAVGGAGTTPSLYNVMTISGKSGNVVAKGEIQSSSLNAFRLSFGKYGVILRNDGNHFFILLTNSGSATSGSWNSFRPFSIDLPTGLTYINGYPGGVKCGTSSTPSGNKGNIYIQYQ